MLASFRTALLMVAALTATVIAPANAGPSGEPLLAAANPTLPMVSVPQLLDPKGEPTLSAPQAPDVQTNESDDDDQPAVKPAGDLASMVAQLRAPEPGNHELECLATGVYFEAKSEPLAGQLAVGKVIANRPESGGRFPGTYCGVLFQRGQFSFVPGRSLPAVNHDESAMADCGRDRRDRRSGPEGSRQLATRCSFMRAMSRRPGACQACRLDRQSRLLSLSLIRRKRAGGLSSSPAFLSPVCSSVAEWPR